MVIYAFAVTHVVITIITKLASWQLSFLNEHLKYLSVLSISRGHFHERNHERHRAHGSPVRVRFGVPFLSPQFNLSFILVIVVQYD